MRTTLFTFFLIISISLTAQEKYIFDTSKIDASTKLIGRYPQYDKQKTYKEFNFIVDEPETIKKVIMTLLLGKEGENTIEDPDFRISIVQSFDEVETWTVNPNSNSVMSNGHTFEFDVKKLKELAKKYPFDYKFDKIPFKSKSDYEQYLEKQKSDKMFLFDYAPQFKYEGSFEIQFPRDSKFSSPKAISDYLTPLIEKIVSKNEYRVSYILNKKNRNDQTQFTMTITGSKKIFNELKLDNSKKENWTETVEEGWFFYRTK
jgi:hypothetical protein